jgi:hypothetical protein
MNERVRWTITVRGGDVEMTIFAPTGDKLDFRLLPGNEVTILELPLIRNAFAEWRTLDGPALITAAAVIVPQEGTP